MAPVTYKVKLTRPQVFLWRMSLFLILAVLLAIILDGQTGQLRPELPGQSRPERADHRRAPGRHRLCVPPGAAALSRDQLGQQFPHLRSRPRAWRRPPVLLAPMATMLKRPHRPSVAGHRRDALAARLGRLAPRRAARDHALSGRPAHLSRPARHVLGFARDGELGRRHHRRARYQCRRERDAVRSIEGRPRRSAEGHGHGLLLPRCSGCRAR